MNQLLYTVGHSTQSADEFVQLIAPHGVNCIVDVRSTPYSKYTPQFNEDVFSAFLKNHGILYAPFGKHFGARRNDCLREVEKKKRGVAMTVNQVNFEEGTKTKDFLDGVERIKKALSQGRTIALMCSESDPLGCHRFSFISRYFYDNGFDVKHIVHDDLSGESVAVNHKDLEMEMIKFYIDHHKLQPVSGQGGYLAIDFGEDSYTEEQQRTDAYRLKNREIGWIANDDNEEEFNF